eukprot:TRINITY_DN6305_c0_g2_i1.p2 TRINITY_DN6305_c0_g2~~TRINITY_DN6305_c0_g2_i1.p2  ORF type:complete len:187 (+),score=30.13 TRINITY_DN6305_c0_g2_i1:1699-2259(+)
MTDSEDAPLRVVVGSKNPVKAEAVKLAFEKMFVGRDIIIETIAAASGVPDQPMGDEETLRGARNRCQACREAISDADYYCAPEGGCSIVGSHLDCFAWMVVVNQAGKEGIAKTGTFALPPEVAKLVQSGMELGHANDKVFATKESKKGGGAVGLLSSGVVTRTTYYEQALVLALIPFHMPDLYPDP